MIENSLLRIKASVSGDNEIKRLGNTMKGVQGQVQNLRSGVGKLAGAFKALFAAAAVSGFAAYVKSAADAADAFGKLEVRTGIAAEKLVGYVQAGKLADVSQDQLIDSLKTLAQTQTEAAKGTASYAEAYAKLGVSVKNSDGTLKASDKLLGEIADQFKDLPDGPEKAALAMNLFGEVGLKLITVLNGGSASLEEFNYNLSDKFAQNAEYYNDQITKLSFAFEGFQMQLMDALMPALISITEVFAELFSTEADWEALFSVIEFGLRSVAIATLTVIKGIDEQIRLVKTAIDIVNTALSGDLGKAGQIAQQYGAGFMERLETSGSQFDRLMFGRGEAPEGYGRRGGRQFQVGDVVGGGARTAKEIADITDEQLQLELQIIEAREKGQALHVIALEADLKILALDQKRIGANKKILELAKIKEESDKKTKDLFENSMQAIIDGIMKEQQELLKTLQIEDDRLETVREYNKLLEEQQTLADPMQGFKAGLDSYVESLGTAFDAVKSFTEVGLNGLDNAISELVTTGTTDFKQFAASLLQEMSQIIIRGLLLRSILSIFGAGKPAVSPLDALGAGFSMGSDLAGMVPNAMGNAYAKNGIVPFAKGGIVDKPKIFPFANGIGLMGEAGPEAIMPLRRTSSGRLGVEATGGTSNIVVNVDASGTRVQGDDTRGKQLGGAISAAVQAELIKQRRPGGLLAS